MPSKKYHIKKLLLLIITVGLFFSFTTTDGSTTVITSDSSTSSVYICKGKYSKKYHYNSNCRGLSNCKSDIVRVSLSSAKQIGRTLCGWED
ncbi:MAG: hypothetical protein JKY08_10205 [Flavobacteriaceae bacterium]|nr:hypothetical protein [Flavobacteriaceae bacterium]